jgi:hypothetical protein
MKSVLDVEVSCFESYQGKQPKPVNLLAWLRSDKYVKEVEALRSIEDKGKRDAIKGQLPAITVSGTFHPSRKEEHLARHSRLICIDIDPKGNEHISNFSALKQELFNIQNVAYAGLSASGKGFFLILPIAYPKRHKQQFLAIKQDLNRFGLEVDSAPQNIASLRGYSYDENALFRHDAKPYRRWKKPKRAKRSHRSFQPTGCHESTRARVEAAINYLVKHRVDTTAYEPDWFRLACSFANEFGEEGRGYFHAISQFHERYNALETDRKYDHALSCRYTSISIGTFFKLAYTHWSGIF